MTTVSVIVPARDAAHTIQATLDALARQARAPDEVIIVDDGSRDRTAELVRNHPLRPVLIGDVGGRGAGQARNAGAARASGLVLAFTDSDCEPTPDWLAKGLVRMESADLVQGSVEQARPPGPFDRTINVTADRGLFETANMFVRRDLFQRLGGFQDFIRQSGRPFGEDALFGWRARRSGARVLFAPEVAVRHAVFPGGPSALLEERWRLRHFPALLARVPELRRYLFARVFLTRRTAAVDLALLSILVALVLSSPLPLLGSIPYLLRLLRDARRGGRRLPLVALTDLLGDVVGFVALVIGSITNRRLLL